MIKEWWHYTDTFSDPSGSRSIEILRRNMPWIARSADTSDTIMNIESAFFYLMNRKEYTEEVLTFMGQYRKVLDKTTNRLLAQWAKICFEQDDLARWASKL